MTRARAAIRSRVALSAVVSVTALLAGCSGSERSESATTSTTTSTDRVPVTDSGPAAPTPVQVDRIRPAIALLESTLGGPQRYVEVNATQTEVNLFVLRDGQDLAYVVRDGVLDPPPTDGAPYDGPTFAGADLNFVPTVIDVVVRNMQESEVVAFSATAGASGIEYIATVRTPKREFRVLLGADGSVLDME